MATTFKTFLNNDITSTKTLLHEAIPLTGTIASGTYNAGGATNNTYDGTNIKNYAHGMFQSVYDYPYLSSSANHIYDLTMGYASGSALSGASNSMNAKKVNIYNQMAQVLAGYDATGSIRNFDEDGNLVDSGAGEGTKLKDCIFINFARLLSKDEIKKGSFTLKLGTGSYATPFSWGGAGNSILTISDSGKENDYRVNSPAGEYAILSATAGYNSHFTNAPACGLIFYQAGIVVLSSSVFQSGSTGGTGVSTGRGILRNDVPFSNINTYFSQSLSGSPISSSCNWFRNRIYDLSFNNTTELNSTIHFCRINHNDFNYSSNPTYLSQSKIVVKNNTLDAPISYATTVGLYSSDNELLAVAKLSEPLKKDPTNEMTIRVRLDY
tara:strand:+ start:12487 stop:13629 length:1143 start_codon:yes stop_codon:yes gene_type:complete